jgi:hypothetical protein
MDLANYWQTRLEHGRRQQSDRHQNTTTCCHSRERNVIVTLGADEGVADNTPHTLHHHIKGNQVGRVYASTLRNRSKGAGAQAAEVVARHGKDSNGP